MYLLCPSLNFKQAAFPAASTRLAVQPDKLIKFPDYRDRPVGISAVHL